MRKLYKVLKKMIKKVLNLFRSEQEISYKYWNSKEDWKVKDALKDRYEQTKKFLLEKYIPLLKKSDLVCDYGCASGEWTLLVSPHVKHVDAYDMNFGLIKNAISEAKKNQIENIHFEVSEASSFAYQSKYNSIMILGVFTCIFNDCVCEEFVRKTSESIVEGGYLIVKDTLTLDKKDMKYVNNDYAGMYRTREKYVDFFTGNRFKLIEETYLMEKKDFQGRHVASFMGIFKKVD